MHVTQWLERLTSDQKVTSSVLVWSTLTNTLSEYMSLMNVHYSSLVSMLLSFPLPRVDALNNQIERMMEYSFENGSKCEKPSSAIKSASHQRRNINFETAIYSRVNNLEERLLHTTQTLDKILEIVSSPGNVTVCLLICVARDK